LEASGNYFFVYTGGPSIQTDIIKQPDLLSKDLNRVPGRLRHIHLVGICGTGMASLAGLLSGLGFKVTGSDRSFYPPMSTFLNALNIPLFNGYQAENLDAGPDLVVVGNVVTRDNPEAVELARRCIPYLSFPQALAHFLLEKTKRIVICGTHGKTTTASLAAWLLTTAGFDPVCMIGGIPLNFDSGCRLGAGAYSVVEGDEYDTAFFDKGPKFLHYRPDIAVLTSVEFDHADIYQNMDHLRESFRKLIKIMPPGGLLIANGDDPEVRRLASTAPCRVVTYGFSEPCSVTASGISNRNGRTGFVAIKDGQTIKELFTPLYGMHNLSNLLAVTALSDALGISAETLALAFSTFRGVKRRQEMVGEPAGITVLDDFAHHPTAVGATIRAVEKKFEGRRLVAVFEPRSNSSRTKIFQEAYSKAFNDADLVFIPDPQNLEKIPPEERFSSVRLVQDLNAAGIEAVHSKNTGELLEMLSRSAKPGDVILLMSNGAFDDLPRRLVNTIENRFKTG
jgi:UDP-N-acetylmuramate: L-alanyl-gamma-D-glutamyl-meso-diaminopimelate ligase